VDGKTRKKPGTKKKRGEMWLMESGDEVEIKHELAKKTSFSQRLMQERRKKGLEKQVAKPEEKAGDTICQNGVCEDTQRERKRVGPWVQGGGEVRVLRKRGTL